MTSCRVHSFAHILFQVWSSLYFYWHVLFVVAMVALQGKDAKEGGKPKKTEQPKKDE